MTAKEWLMRAWNIDKEIKALLSERNEAFRKCTAITATLKADTISSSSAPQKDHWLITLSEYDHNLGGIVDSLVKTKKEILSVISLLDNETYKTLLYLRYLRFKTWEEVADGIGKTVSMTKIKLHDRAVDAIKIPDDTASSISIDR